MDVLLSLILMGKEQMNPRSGRGNFSLPSEARVRCAFLMTFCLLFAAKLAGTETLQHSAVRAGWWGPNS